MHVLKAMADAGLIQQGFARLSIERGMAYLRTSNTKKESS